VTILGRRARDCLDVGKSEARTRSGGHGLGDREESAARIDLDNDRDLDAYLFSALRAASPWLREELVRCQVPLVVG